MSLNTLTRPRASHVTSAWIAALIIGSVILSGKFSCATPFAALAALAALDFNRKEGLLVVLAVWLANQFVGFAFLGYPHEATTYAWGLAIGLAALASYVAARAVSTKLPNANLAIVCAASLAAAFIAYEAVLFAATALLSDDGTFSTQIILQIGAVNLVAFVALVLVRRLIAMSGWMPRLSTASPAMAHAG